MADTDVVNGDPLDREQPNDLSALKALWPFLKPYKFTMLSAFLALTLTAAVSLILPLAVRRVIDTFSSDNTLMLDQYFLAAIGIAGLLSIGTAVRYALVTK